MRLPPRQGEGGEILTTDGAAGTGSTPERMSSWRRHRLLAVHATVLLATVAGVTMVQSRVDRGSEEVGELSAQLAEARRLADGGQPVEALGRYTEILAEHPDNVEALAYGGWLVRLAGRLSDDPAAVDKGLASIERALVVDPSYPDAHFFRGVILYRDKREPEGAVQAFRACLAANPPAEMVPHVEKLLGEALTALGASPP